LHHMPVEWTSVAPPDPFRKVARGRCYFRAEDLRQLADLVASLSSGGLKKRKGKDAASVKTTPPHEKNYRRPAAKRRARKCP
jgi:hypothetical protein